jgi:hypothetical protein
MKKKTIYEVSRKELIAMFLRKNNIKEESVAFSRLSSDGLRIGVD